MRARPHVWLLLWFLLAAALPAYASGPPQPDGMVGILLLFPVVILGLRAAGAKRPEASRGRRIVGGTLLGFSILLTMAGTELALIPLVILLVYGLFRGGEAMRYGHGSKRWAIGAAMMMFTLFAVFNYLASLSWPRAPYVTQRTAIATLRNLVSAQIRFRDEAKADRNGNGAGEFGTLDQVGSFSPGGTLTAAVEGRGDYSFVVVLTGDAAKDEKEFFAYATPLHYGEQPWQLSAVRAFTRQVHYSRMTFAVDESGVIRHRDLGSARAVTREEAATWPEVD